MLLFFRVAIKSIMPAERDFEMACIGIANAAKERKHLANRIDLQPKKGKYFVNVIFIMWLTV